MRIISRVLAGTLLAAGTIAANEPLLPAWTGTGRADLEAAGWIPGALLLTDEFLPDEQQPESLKMELPKPEDIAGDSAPSTEVAEEFLPAYFAERPKSFLIDPQNLLSGPDHRDRLGFLNYHASDSSIDLFVYVIGGGQDIPSEVREEETIERFFAEGRPAAIVYYYLGAPQRSVVYLSPSLTDAVSAAEQHRALESSIMQAFEKVDASGQFEKFLVQMSIRIYWMERMISGEPAAPLPPVALPKIAPAEKFLWLRQLAVRYGLPGASLAATFLTLFGLHHWLGLRARYRFPEFEVEPRLGGAHAAGVGAVISFTSAALPPASQRDQVPDYLRRA